MVLHTDSGFLARIFLVIISLTSLVANSGLCQRISFWHPWTQSGPAITILGAEYTRRTGVRVDVRVFSLTGYNPWRGGAQPDIIGLSYPTRLTISRNAREGRLYNMQIAIQQGWYSDLWPGPVSIFELSGTDAPGGQRGIYGVPLTAFVRVFIYNTELFRRAGVSPPETLSDFLLAGPRLRRLGVTPFAGGFDGIYPAYPAIYERSYLGAHYLFETYYGRYPYTGTRWQNLFRIYTELRQYRMTDFNEAQMNRTAAARYFLNGRAAIILDGPWFENIRHSYSPAFRNWRVFGPPQDHRAPFIASLPGGVAEGAVINSRSTNKAAAVRFLRWLTEPAQQVRLANAAGSLPISQRATSSPALHGYLRMFTPYLRYSAIDLRVYEEQRTLEVLYGGVRNVIRGTSTPTRVLNNTQQVAR